MRRKVSHIKEVAYDWRCKVCDTAYGHKTPALRVRSSGHIMWHGGKKKSHRTLVCLQCAKAFLRFFGGRRKDISVMADDIKNDPEMEKFMLPINLGPMYGGREANNKVSECPFCHMEYDADNFYTCPSCDSESCTDCGGRCGCEVEV